MAASDREVVDLISDSEDDEDLKRAIALSLQDQETASEASDEIVTESKAEAEPEVKGKEPVPTSVGILALDRKQMEQDRLARLAKRQRETSGTEAEDSSEQPPAKKRMQNSSSSLPFTTPVSSSSTVPFPKGVVKRTWAQGYPRTKDDIKIEEVLNKGQLQLAILSSFQWDEEWLLSKIDMAKTKLLLVAYAPDEAQVSRYAIEQHGLRKPAYPTFGELTSKIASRSETSNA